MWRHWLRRTVIGLSEPSGSSIAWPAPSEISTYGRAATASWPGSEVCVSTAASSANVSAGA